MHGNTKHSQWLRHVTVTEQKAIMKDLSFISNFVLIIIKILKIGLPVLVSKNVLIN